MKDVQAYERFVVHILRSVLTLEAGNADTQEERDVAQAMLNRLNANLPLLTTPPSP